MKEIKINDDVVMMVDDEDYDYLMLYDIYLNQHGYPYCKPKPKYKKMGLFSSKLAHSVLLDKGVKGRKIVIDHIDGNKLNNQKSNLRVCTHTDNMRNRKPQCIYANKEVASKYKGVYWFKEQEIWRVQVYVNGKRKPYGLFTNEIAASNCYNYYAKESFGEFALLNDCPYMPKEEWQQYMRGTKRSSKYIGVCYSKNDKKWIAQICHNYHRTRIGSFDTEIEAVIAYNQKAIELKGDKAKLNKFENL